MQELCFCTFVPINSCPHTTDYTALFVFSCVCRPPSMVAKMQLLKKKLKTSSFELGGIVSLGYAAVVFFNVFF